MARNVHWQAMSSSSTEASKHSGSSTSAQSRSTALTEQSCRPSLSQFDTCYGRVEGWEDFGSHEYMSDDARASVETYASTVPSETGLEEDPIPEYEVPELRHQNRGQGAIPATPRDFGELFPSSRTVSITHDDSTVDGNMNLRLDIPVKVRSGKQRPMTLFHLRMHDLRNREFSLRRYCRDSGREVCHSVRKYQQPVAERRPSFHRSFSSALATLRPSKNPNNSGLQRQDSGYESVYDPVSPRDESSRFKQPSERPMSMMPTNTIKLEFSNYAHIDVKRRGAKTNKRYEFEYWGHQYSWRKVVRKDGDHRITSYHLLRDEDEFSLARIVPVHLSSAAAREEAAKGGWIPPCSMKIIDDSILDSADLADVVVSTGLMALVDDSIKQRFHTKQTTQIMIPLTKNASFKMNMDSLAPKRLIDEVFHRAPRILNEDQSPMHGIRRNSIAV